MLRKSVLITVAGVLMFLFSSVVLAGDHDPGVQTRILEQQRRIDQGIASGQLTRGEADIVQDNLNRIRDAEARMKADGALTPHERVRLRHMLDRNSKMIYREKHNAIQRID